jgi:hypothetical protein
MTPFPESGNLQMALFIHMTIDLFERVEALLGLPSEFRIDHQIRKSGGLLAHEEYAGMLEVVIGTEERRQLAHGGGGGMRALRRSIKRARELLRDHIP